MINSHKISHLLFCSKIVTTEEAIDPESVPVLVLVIVDFHDGTIDLSATGSSVVAFCFFFSKQKQKSVIYMPVYPSKDKQRERKKT